MSGRDDDPIPLRVSDLGNVLAGAFACLVLYRLMGRPGVADEISELGAGFTQSIRVAQGLAPEPTVDEKILKLTAGWLADPDGEVADLEAGLDRELGLTRPVSGSGRQRRGSVRRRASAWRRLDE